MENRQTNKCGGIVMAINEYFIMWCIIMAGNFIAEFGISLIALYCTMKILEFYGIDKDEYAIFVAFYLFLAMCKFVLPNKKE